jgi:hypothetical protein
VNGTLKNARPDGRVQIDIRDIEVLIYQQQEVGKGKSRYSAQAR